MHTLHHTWTIPGGSPGQDESPTNPLNRATAQLFRYGKPFPRLCMCFFKDARGTLRWLGVFVHSAGSRVLFFPGFADTFKEVQHGFKAKSQRNQPFDFDHVSLESDLQSWHITSVRSEDHIGKPRTLDIGKSRVLWFGMSVADANVLRIVREETRITSFVPASDSKRRSDALVAARDGAQFPIVSLNTEHSTSYPQGFLHFALIVGPKGFQEYSGPEFGAPFESPCLVAPLPNPLLNLPVRYHRVELSASIDIQITCCALPGQLTVPVAFTGLSGRRLDGPQ